HRRGPADLAFFVFRGCGPRSPCLRFRSLKLDRWRHRQVTPPRLSSPTLNIMRGAFVVQLGPETKPSEGRFEGLVEEVDSGRELRFRSAEELMTFLGQRFDLVEPRPAKSKSATRSSRFQRGRRIPLKKEARHEHGTHSG